MADKKEAKQKLIEFRIEKLRESCSKLELYSQLAEELGELAQISLNLATLTMSYPKQKVGLFGSSLIHAIEEYTDVMTVLDVLDIQESDESGESYTDKDGDSSRGGSELWIKIANACLYIQHSCFKAMRYLSGSYVSGELADFETSIMKGIIELKSICNDSYLYKDSDLFDIKVSRWFARMCVAGRIVVNDISEEEEGGENNGNEEVPEESDQE